MSDARKRLLAVARLRTKVVTIDGEDFTVREVSAEKFSEYRETLVQDHVRAVAVIISECLIDGDPPAPYLSVEDALEIAKSARVGLKLLRGVLDVSGYGEGAEKEPDAT